MKMHLRLALAGGISGAAFAAFSGARAQDAALGVEGIEEFWLATDAYVYGYPLVTMEMTRRMRLYWPSETPPSKKVP
jgi:hypothetical protein